MAKKRRHGSLGNPMTVLAVSKAVKDNPEMATYLVDRAESTISKGAKTLLLVGGLLIGGLIGRKQYKLWKDRQDVKGEAGSTKRATLTESQARVYANKLYSAMNGAGTNESEVMQVFQACVNNDDVNLLILQFGKRDGETLSEWINDDFSSSAKEKYINSVLRAKGITKLF